MLYATHNTIKEVMNDLIILKWFSSFRIFSCTQPSFVFHLQINFYIVHDHTVSFFLWIVFDIFEFSD